MGEILTGACEKCGATGQLNRITEDFHFPCLCHSPTHFILHYLCDHCLHTFKEDPNKKFQVIVSVDTFGIFLKAYPKISQKYKKFFDIKELNPKYQIDSFTNEPEIRINCTYDLLIYLGQIYEEWMHLQSAKNT